METRQAVQRFCDGLARKYTSWQEVLAADVTFSDASGRLRADGRDAFIQSFTSFLRAVDRVEVTQLILEGPHSAAVVSYDYTNARSEHLHQDDAEVWKVEDGEIAY